MLNEHNGFAKVEQDFEELRSKAGLGKGSDEEEGPALGGDGSAAGPARGKKRLSEGLAPTGEEAMGGGPALGGNMGGGPAPGVVDLTHSPAKKHKGGSPAKNRSDGFTTLRDVTMRALDRSGIADYLISEKGAGEKERALVTFLKALMADP